MPKYKDNLSGKIEEFDHEPSQQELAERFGVSHVLAGPSLGGPKPYNAEEEKSAIAPGIGGMIGGVIGGKTPLGKVGAGIGAAAGTAYGDLYNMITHGVGDTTPSSEARRLATVGGLTTAAETILPPALRGIGRIKDMLPQGSGLLGAGGLGWLFGHPGVGAGVGAAIEAAPKVAAGIDALGTPAGTSAGNAAKQDFLKGFPAQYANNSGVQQQAESIGEAARKKAAGPMGEVPDYLKQENWGDTAKRAGNYVKDKASAALEGLQGMFGSTPKPPTAPPSPRMSGGTEIPYRISEDMLPDYNHVKAPSGGQEGMVYPNLTREPNLKYGADVSAAPFRTPDITQTHPMDPAMPWEEHAARSAPRRTGTAGGTFGGVEVSTPLKGLQAADPNLNGGVGDPMLAGSAPSPRTTGPTSISPVKDVGLQRFLEAGGTVEDWTRLKNDHPFGPNTVGAAQAPQHLPMSVDEAEGMSLPELDQWEAFKRKTGASDAHLDDWFVANQKGADPHAGLDVNAKVDKLLSLLNPRK